jgi:hypothetical protein
MTNTITAVMPSLFAGLDVISREMIGIIPAVQRNANMERAAVGQTVNVPVVPPATGGNITPASVPPDDGDDTIGAQTVAITKSKYSPVRWNGEEQLALGPTGEYNQILADQFAQAMRWLANQVEADLITAAYKNASRAYGTPGTTPFGVAGDLTDFAGVNRILDQNGAPMYGRQLIVGSDARYNLEGKQSVLFKVNEAGDDGAFLNRRVTPPVQNLTIGFSAAVPLVAAGTGASYLINGAQAVGETGLEIDGGSGTAPQGTFVTIAGDSNKYMLNADGTTTLLKIGAPGLRLAAADNAAVTMGGAFTANVAFTQNALVLAARAPALPTGGDMADDRTIVTDPVSGISFEVSLYREYRRVRYEVALAWGVGVVKPEHIAVLLG